MASSVPFRVIIAGGGIAGLALANMLERVHIDFILLERKEIAPELGAGLAIQCNGVKILEQLGIWQNMHPSSTPCSGHRYFDERGRLLEETSVLNSVGEKTGRPIVFVERRGCLKMLYENINDKSRIISNTGVVSFSESEDGITVMTNHGKSISGSILVAADGVHSMIRGLLAEAVRENDPERYQYLTEGFTSSYRAIFGISSYQPRNDVQVPLVPDGMVHIAHNENSSSLASATLDAHVIWFVSMKEETVSTTPNCPRYTDLDTAETLEKYGHLNASPGITYRNLWQSRIKGGMFPMEEGVIQTSWNNGGRVVLVGDAACRTTVNPGLGGNLTIEGVCVLANELVALLQRTQVPQVQDITGAFKRYEQAHRPRAKMTMDMSNYLTRYEATDSTWMRLLRWLSPWTPQWYKVRLLVNYFEGAPILDSVPSSGVH
ncbi:FAD/NAD(P)-binding domain-containing protein [Hypoxylon trugodes]|uniref:FAD/NAD(P)-binding domain-containing protein n=1 Tax=Hypoxylon trugodes TaxID=326681 RepID=UPI002194ECBB|nr:FAD/NAD(P)-binding domain-containing protein [Hypoxylon trugodes]KAI1382711.1 FAD/NAD(P)-binding domain-containing protein [Hypoxylon trugodes]